MPVEVADLYPEAQCETRIWVSDRALDVLLDAPNEFGKKLQRCAEDGFGLYERGNWPAIRHEGDGVYRFGIRRSLHRIIGFYEDGTDKGSFIAVDGFLKRGQRLGRAERNRISDAARIKRDSDWRRKSNDP